MKNFSKLLSIAAIGVFAVSCSQSEDLTSIEASNEATPITFVTKVPGTRLNVKTTSGFVQGDSVGLFSHSKSENLNNDFSLSGGLFNNTKMTYDATASKWSYGDPKYWSKKTNEKLSVLAYFPYVGSAQTANVLSAPTLVNDNITFTVKLPTDLTLQKDLMWAKIKDVTTATQTAAQNLAFSHAYGQIGFKFKLAGTYAGVTIKLKKVEILKLNNEGKFTIDRNLAATQWEFSGTYPNNPEADFTLFDGTQTLTTSYVALGGGTNVSDYRTFVIPRTGFDDNVELRLSYDIEYSDGVTPTQSVVVTNTFVKSIAAGNLYTYQIGISLSGITFNAPSVTDMTNTDAMPETM